MASTPAQISPGEDIASWKRQASEERSSLLTPDYLAFVQRGVSVTLATSGLNGRPAVGMGVGCRVRPDGRLRVLLSQTANVALLDALSAGRALAVTFTGAPDHRAFQVKALSAKVQPACSDDLPEMDRQCALFCDELIELGFPPDLARGFVAFDPGQLVAIEFIPDRIFTQTPGPGAGAELTR
jgi:hypothetical protein